MRRIRQAGKLWYVSTTHPLFGKLLMTNQQHLVLACAAMAVLVFLVGLRLLQNRVQEMRAKRINPQQTSNSIQMAAKLENVQAADNYKNLFEVPILFYALCAIAISVAYIPNWLVYLCWLFVALRYTHSFIQCTYNKVMHRFPVFLASLTLIVGLWVAFTVSYLTRV
jgi:hypothetical protein